MDIGETKPVIVIEPIEEPVPGKKKPTPVEPEPVKEPVAVPA